MRKQRFGLVFAGIAVIGAAGMVLSCRSAPSGGGVESARTSGVESAEASSGRKIHGGVPEFVKNAVKNSPENALIGIGTAKMATISQSRTIAATRGRAELSRQMNTMVRDMVRDFTQGSEVDPSATIAFQENFTRALSESTLEGSSVVEEDMDESGAYWCVVILGKSDTVREINQTAAAAKLKVPAMASFDAERRMDEAFEKAAKEEIQIADSN
jgi:hypothetical protein